ncbi:MAG: enoyl-CoA hydratase/isomerase family protein [Chloroflexota bacterium]|nr:MAG: enoyl-CoA hydratase/isomerase family protein [Chloroflexota bacterium]
MAEYEYITFSDGEVAVLTLNRPEVLNSLNAEMLDEIHQALDIVRLSQSIRSLVINGAGRAFCAGWDIGDMGDGSRREVVDVLSDMLRVGQLATELYSLPKPVVVAINGVAAGGGCGISLAADFRVLSEDAKVVFAFINVGFVPDTGTAYFLPRLVGLAKAKELMMRGQSIDAAEALRLGLATKVVPAADLQEAALQLATELARKPAEAMQLTKLGANGSLEMDLKAALAYEAAAQMGLSQSAAHLEAVAQFTRKSRR